MKIGLLDSGVAGLAVARMLQNRLPSHELVYLGDTARFPYGIKSPSLVARHVERGLEWLVDRGVERIGIVCGSAAAVAVAGLARPAAAVVLEDTVSAGADEALRAGPKGPIGVLGSPVVMETGVFRKRIEGAGSTARVFHAAAPLLGPLVLEGWIRRPETRRIVKKALHPLKLRQIDSLIIASTAGIVLAGLIREKAGPRVTVVDAGQALVGRLAADLHPIFSAGDNPSETGRFECWLTDTAGHFSVAAQRFFKARIVVRQVPGF
jgi:glutamate racemase